ncbi:hypothetical protein B0H17DRAFT_1136964 [Mycena rosella]|uniref:Uncharacterized protein n=1 Tax=Mycena rosella TaxID=1033263 RepID=A0AAD7D9V2_MYCRO|nr:hypothetical protein B0H17DRAFT_1136964 [Mycena rosella]
MKKLLRHQTSIAWPGPGRTGDPSEPSESTYVSVNIARPESNGELHSKQLKDTSTTARRRRRGRVSTVRMEENESGAGCALGEVRARAASVLQGRGLRLYCILGRTMHEPMSELAGSSSIASRTERPRAGAATALSADKSSPHLRFPPMHESSVDSRFRASSPPPRVLHATLLPRRRRLHPSRLSASLVSKSSWTTCCFRSCCKHGIEGAFAARAQDGDSGGGGEFGIPWLRSVPAAHEPLRPSSPRLERALARVGVGIGYWTPAELEPRGAVYVHSICERPGGRIGGALELVAAAACRLRACARQLTRAARDVGAGNDAYTDITGTARYRGARVKSRVLRMLPFSSSWAYRVRAPQTPRTPIFLFLTPLIFPCSVPVYPAYTLLNHLCLQSRPATARGRRARRALPREQVCKARGRNWICASRSLFICGGFLYSVFLDVPGVRRAGTGGGECNVVRVFGTQLKEGECLLEWAAKGATEAIVKRASWREAEERSARGHVPSRAPTPRRVPRGAPAPRRIPKCAPAPRHVVAAISFPPDNEALSTPTVPAITPAPFPPLPPHSAQKENETVQDFFARRTARNQRKMEKRIPLTGSDARSAQHTRKRAESHQKLGFSSGRNRMDTTSANPELFEGNNPIFGESPAKVSARDDDNDDDNNNNDLQEFAYLTPLATQLTRGGGPMEVVQKQHPHDVEMAPIEEVPKEYDLSLDFKESELLKCNLAEASQKCVNLVYRKFGLPRTEEPVYELSAQNLLTTLEKRFGFVMQASPNGFIPLNLPQETLVPQHLANVVGMTDIGAQLASPKGLENTLGIFFGQCIAACSVNDIDKALFDYHQPERFTRPLSSFEFQQELLKSMRNPLKHIHYYVLRKISSGIGSEVILIP